MSQSRAMSAVESVANVAIGYGAAVRSAMEVFPDQITPLVAPTLDMAEVHEILTQSCHEVLRRVADDIAKQKAAIQPKETAA